MLEFIAVSLAAIMIPASPMNAIMPENYSGYSEPTAYVQQMDATTATIYTFNNNTPIVVSCPSEADSVTLDNNDDKFVDPYYNSYGELVELDVYQLERSSFTYNNFAYAFYMYWGGSIACVLDDPEPFINDHSFEKVTEPQIGDIVCYCLGNYVIHAGIIKAVLNKSESNEIASNLIVQSKWFNFGVYEHRGDLNPYMRLYAAILFI